MTDTSAIDAKNAVSLVVNGQAFGGWKSVRIEAGIERQARSFALTVTERWPGADGSPVPARRVRSGHACEVYIGADRVLTGYVDATPVQYDANSISLNVRGRSKTADLVDCCPITPPTQWRGLKLEAIAAALASPYGVKVVTQVGTGAAIADFSLQAGESVFESIDRLMRMRHVLSTDNAMGELVFIAVGSSKASTALVLGQNIRTGSADLDFKDVYTQYICRAQRPIADDESPEDGSEEEADDDETPAGPDYTIDAAEVADASASALLGRRRLLVIKSSGQADEGTCLDRVQYERAHRAAKALETKYVVGGWRQESGELWQSNMLVHVVDPMVGLNRSMLISEIAYVLDDTGLRCEVTVGPPDGYVNKAGKSIKVKGGAGSVDWSDIVSAKGGS